VVVAQITLTRTARTPRLCVPTLAVAAATAAVVWVGAVTLERSGSVGRTLAAGREELVGPALIVLVLAVLVCERIWPAERRRLLARGHVQDTCFFLLYASTVVPFMTLMGVAFAYLLGTHAHWIEASWTAAWPRWLLIGVTLVAMDLCNWMAHWADHRLAPLWRLHAVHHTQEELSVLTSFRAHPLVHVVGFMLATVPVVALTGFHPLAPVLITVYLCLGTLTHANVPWSFGPLGKIFVSPAYHREHHSVHCPNGANLGVVLTIWDVFARRAVFPQKGEPVCATGLCGRPLAVEQVDGRHRPVALLVSQLLEPFGPPPPFAASSPGRVSPARGSGRMARPAPD
jgi:sterol desaturase/sphingolipid hydroxylase (fatty acid hydroxylase superfamily)